MILIFKEIVGSEAFKSVWSKSLWRKVPLVVGHNSVCAASNGSGQNMAIFFVILHCRNQILVSIHGRIAKCFLHRCEAARHLILRVFELNKKCSPNLV